MKFILDSNIVMSALIKDSTTRKIIFRSGFDFYHPKIALKNLDKHKETILKKSGLDSNEYENILKLVVENIKVVELSVFLDKLDEAQEIIGDIDIEDSPFIALALSIENDGIWSDDLHFQKQNKVRVWTTDEILKKFNENNHS